MLMLATMEKPQVPPPGGYQNLSGGILATTILVTVLSIVLLTLRFATRKYHSSLPATGVRKIFDL